MVIYRYFIENSKLYVNKLENVEDDGCTYYDKDEQYDICSVSKLDSNLVENMFYDSGCISGLFYTTEQSFEHIKNMFLEDVVKRQKYAKKKYEDSLKQLNEEIIMINDSYVEA